MIRRILDIVISIIAIVLLLPVMVLIALAIRLESRGWPIFRQRRAGYHGRAFTMLKFRTMRADVDPYGISPHGPKDPRLTRVGRWLREKSLDELPQLFNVLAGQMSIVGPRPLYERQAERWNQRQRARLDVKPGMTGYAQVFGRGTLTHEDKIELDLKYVRTRSFWLDLRIIFRTIVILVGRRGDTYERRYSRHKEREAD